MLQRSLSGVDFTRGISIFKHSVFHMDGVDSKELNTVALFLVSAIFSMIFTVEKYVRIDYGISKNCLAPKTKATV